MRIQKTFSSPPMSSQRVQFEAAFKVPPAVVFATFADHVKFGGIWGSKMERIKAGSLPEEPNGEGSVRRIASGGFTFEETITVFEKNRLIEYTVTQGGPIKNHLGHIEFRADGRGGTRVSYTITFSPKIPLTGGLIAAIIRKQWNSGIGPARTRIEAGE